MNEIQQIFSFQEIPQEEYILPGTQACPGCGPLLGFRLAMKIIGKDGVVVANGPCAELIGSTSQVPFCVFPRVAKMPPGERRVFFFDQLADIGALEEFVKGNKNFIIISCNNEEKPLVKIMDAMGLPYVASACVSYPLDFLNKVRKGLRYKRSFVHLLAPCPVKWGFDPSNTVEIGKSAVSCGIFPLYEIKEKEFMLNFRPRMLDPVKHYYDLQHRFHLLTPQEKERKQNRIGLNWKFMQAGKFWMTK